MLRMLTQILYTASYLSFFQFPLHSPLEGLLNYSCCCLLQPATVLPGEPMVVDYSYQKCGTPASHLVAVLYCYWFPPPQTPSRMCIAKEPVVNWDHSREGMSEIFVIHFEVFVILQLSQYIVLCRVLPSTRFVVRQVSEVVVYGWNLVMKIKEPTDNHISILEQTLVAGCAPASTRHCLNQL